MARYVTQCKNIELTKAFDNYKKTVTLLLSYSGKEQSDSSESLCPEIKFNADDS